MRIETPYLTSLNGRFAWQSDEYRFSFNGKEDDKELEAQQDYGMRIYNLRLARFLSIDPLTKDFPELTPYQFSGNSPIENVDLDGLEPMKNGLVTQEMREGKTKLKKPEVQQWGTMENSLFVQRSLRDTRLKPILEKHGSIDKAIEAELKQLKIIDQKEKVNQEDYVNMLKTSKPDPGDPGMGLTLVKIIKTLKYEVAKNKLQTERKIIKADMSDLTIKKAEISDFDNGKSELTKKK